MTKDGKGKKKDPDISIIIPVYNRAHYLTKLVDCIKAQTFYNFECIMIDDGSTDKSGTLCDLLTSDDDRFVVRHISNTGVSHARNIGLDIAKGKYLTFIDSDDIIPENYLEVLVKKICSLNVDMVIGSFCRIYQDSGRVEKIEYSIQDRVYSMKELMPEFAAMQKRSGVYGRCWAKLVCRNFIDNVRFDESLKLAEDFDFFLQVYPRIKTVYFDNTCEYGYVKGARNSSEMVPDDEIDYTAQTKVSIRYKQFLERQNSFSEKNKDIVSEQIQKYLYFSIFHCDMNKFRNTFQQTYDLYNSSGIEITSCRGMEDVILKCVKKNNEKKAFIIMKLYRFMRKIMKGH